VAIALVVALLAAGLATVAVRAGEGGGGRSHVASRAQVTTSTSPTITIAPETTTSSGPTTTQPIPAALSQTLVQIKDQVAQVRGLPWLAPLDVQVAPDAEFLRQWDAVTQRDLRPDRVQGDGETFKVLKLIPQGTDYLKTTLDLLHSAVLGFYDPKTTKLLVRAGRTTLTPEQRITVAHEMDHALTDQHFKFGPATYALDAADKQEEYSAFSGLLEGDAKLLEALWAGKYLTPKERTQAASGSGSSSAASVVAKMPPFMVDTLYFPYTTGRAFVISHYRTGGWAAVNAAYARPPDSTLVVTHPELYDAGRTWATPAFPDLAATTGCTPVRTGTLGDFNMTEVLTEHLDETTSGDAADGWNGDFFATVRCGSARGFADRWTAPDTASAGKLVSALSSWAGDWSGGHAKPASDGRFSGSSGAGRLVQAGTRVDLVLADDTATADKVAAALGD
jgi:hypothetical protein